MKQLQKYIYTMNKTVYVSGAIQKWTLFDFL